MQAPYSDRWERTKRYLLRNFLVNPGFQLSPIPEEDRSSPDSSSSLPELVIEREPNRHDDSEKFYAELERRMRLYYRQLFLGETVAEDEDSLDFEVNRSTTSTLIIEGQEQNGATGKSSASESNLSILNERQSRNFANQYHGSDNCENLITYNVSEKVDNQINEIGHLSESVDQDSKVVNTPSGNSKIMTDETVNVPDLNEEGNDDNYRLSLINTSRFEPHDSLIGKEVLETRNRGENVSDAIVSKSDTDDSIPCHRISTTVVEIHERPPLRRPRVFEDGSPVLLPRFIRFGKSIFGPRIKNAEQSYQANPKDSGQITDGGLSQNAKEFDVQDVNIEDTTQNVGKGNVNINEKSETVEEETEVCEAEADTTEKSENSEQETDNIEEKTQNIEEEDENVDGEEENDLGETENVSVNVEQGTESIEEETIVQRLLTASEITNVSQDLAITLVSDWLLKDVRINEDDRNELSGGDKSSRPTIEDLGQEFEHENSFENAVRKGVFIRKNIRKTFVFNTNDEMESSDEYEMESSDEYFETLEEMRRPREVAANASLMIESAGIEDSPIPAFETKTNAGELEEVSEEINAQENEIQMESNELQRTPSRESPRTNLNALLDFWSVSPIQVDIESQNDANHGLKRKTDARDEVRSKKKRKDVSVQVSSNTSNKVGATWENLKKDIFVGSPLVLRLCACQDHVCSS